MNSKDNAVALAPTPSNQDLKDMILFDEESGHIWLDQQRMILLHASAFGSLRSELIHTVGIEYSMGVLMRMGFSSAQSDAQLAKKLRPNASTLDKFIVGPQLHSLEGIVSVEPISINIDIDAGQFFGEYV